jgi:hypothetical protein
MVEYPYFPGKTGNWGYRYQSIWNGKTPKSHKFSAVSARERGEKRINRVKFFPWFP